jgi:hypothetical protein
LTPEQRKAVNTEYDKRFKDYTQAQLRLERGNGPLRRGRGIAVGLKAAISPTTSVATVAIAADGERLAPADPLREALQHRRGRERQMKQFKSAGQAQRFLSAHDQINNLFPPPRSRRCRRAQSFQDPKVPDLGGNLRCGLAINSQFALPATSIQLTRRGKLTVPAYRYLEEAQAVAPAIADAPVLGTAICTRAHSIATFDPLTAGILFVPQQPIAK